MIWVYVAAAIFGGSFLIPMVLGGLASDFEADVGSDVDLDLEVEADLEFEAGGPELEAGGVDVGSPDIDGPELGADAVGVDVGGGAFDGAFGAVFSSIVSFRTVVFFSAFFGFAGLVFGWLGYGSVATFGSAVLIGAIAAAINAALFGFIKHSQVSSHISDRTLEGRLAKVVLPMSPEQRGRIRVDLSGQPQYLVARAIAEGSATQFDVGTSVVVVKIENGTALVSPVPELDAGEE